MRRGEAAWLRLRCYVALVFLLASFALLARMAVSYLGDSTMRTLCRAGAVFLVLWPFAVLLLADSALPPVGIALFAIWATASVIYAVRIWSWATVWGDDA